MKPRVECNICYKRGDGYWANWHRKYVGHNNFTLLCGDEDEPPQSLMGVVSRAVSTFSALAERFESIGRLWSGDWGVYPVRGSLSNRRLLILMDI